MNNIQIKAGIVGGAGYTGGEMIRLLLHHPQVILSFVHSRSNAGAPLSKVHQDLAGQTDLLFCSDIDTSVDVVFLCVGHGAAKEFMAANPLSADTRIIDLSQDFRLSANSVVNDRTFVYGLPELNRDMICNAGNIANPGCFATAIQLSVLPLAKAGLLQEAFTTGITGSTGAGQQLQGTSHFSWRVNNIQAYKSLAHQHMKEITESINSLQPGSAPLHFIPWRGDFARGIYVSTHTATGMSLEEAYALYNEFYKGHPFTYVSREMIDLKQVVNTNRCHIHLEKEYDRLIIHAAIDNLLKGASGQAVQNMNIMFGLPEDAGLKLKSIAF